MLHKLLGPVQACVFRDAGRDSECWEVLPVDRRASDVRPELGPNSDSAFVYSGSVRL